MLAWQFENEFTHERVTLSDAQIQTLKIDIGKWAKENGYHCVKSFELKESDKAGKEKDEQA